MNTNPSSHRKKIFTLHIYYHHTTLSINDSKLINSEHFINCNINLIIFTTFTLKRKVSVFVCCYFSSVNIHIIFQTIYAQDTVFVKVTGHKYSEPNISVFSIIYIENNLRSISIGFLSNMKNYEKKKFKIEYCMYGGYDKSVYIALFIQCIL